MSVELFERYDIRGKHPEEIDEEFAVDIGAAYASFVRESDDSKVVVCRDTKESSKGLKEAVIKGLLSSGIDVLDAGIGPTDYCAFAGKERNCFSVQITSSHLPYDNNGFKFIYPAGNSLINEDLARIKDLYKQGSDSRDSGELRDVSERLKSDYIDEAVRFLSDNGLKPHSSVYIETMGGAGGELIEKVLDTSDIKNKISDGKFDPPNPEKHELRDLREAVDSGQYDLGVAMDMDADRAQIYFDGAWMNGDTVFAVLADVFDPETVVGSLDSSDAVRKAFDGKFVDTRVGDPFVLEKLIEEDAPLGGEPNCHYAFREFVPYHSGTMTALVISALDLESILKRVKDISIKKVSVNVEDKELALKKISGIIEEKFEVVSRQDGIKYITGDESVLIRSSGTSEKLRITSYGKDNTKAERALEEAVDLIE